jgi:COP9 signalosome complex subunit 3
MRSYVSRLSRTFSAIPVSNIASSAGAEANEIAQYIDSLIKDGHLNARLEETDKSNAGVVLRFYLDPAQGPLAKSEKQQQQALFEQTKEYVENQKRLNKRQGSEAMDTAWDDSIDVDEDIMVDMR